MAKKQKIKARDISAATKRKIYKRFVNEEIRVQNLADEYNTSYFTMYRIITGQTKLDGTPRSDKGRKRKSDDNAQPSRFNMDDFNSVDDFLMFTLVDALELSVTQKLDVADRVRIAKDINAIQTKIQQRQLVDNVRRPDAEVIAIIIRKYEPDADYKRCVEVYTEAQEKYIREK